MEKGSSQPPCLCVSLPLTYGPCVEGPQRQQGAIGFHSVFKCSRYKCVCSGIWSTGASTKEEIEQATHRSNRVPSDPTHQALSLTVVASILSKANTSNSTNKVVLCLTQPRLSSILISRNFACLISASPYKKSLSNATRRKRETVDLAVSSVSVSNSTTSLASSTSVSSLLYVVYFFQSPTPAFVELSLLVVSVRTLCRSARPDSV